MVGNRRSLALCALTVSELARGLENGSFSSEAVTDAYLENIALQNSTLNVFLEVFGDTAREEARASDRRRREGKPLSRLDGVPFAVKDNLCVEGRLCTCASRMLENYRSPYTATAVRRLQEAGMPLLGRVNLDEFAMGSSTETSFFGPSRNPWDASRVPGGSSGGCAAAVAAGMAPVALGSDTGGSIRQPASFCGVVGVKPAYGAVSRYGLVAFASSLDQIGPLAKTAVDAALVLDIICGHDPRDATSDPALIHRYADAIAGFNMRGFTIGMPKECFGTGLSDEVRMAAKNAAESLRRLGAEIREVSIPSLPYALPAYYVISSAEASSNLARFDGVRYGYRAREYADLDELYRKSRQEAFGTEPGDLLTATGPSIGACCFETDDDVPDAMRRALGAAAEPYMVRRGEKWHIDLKGINALWLRQAGVQHIDVCPDCTGCHPERWWSHRKMGDRRGAQAALIALI